ncbi:cation diffusion facilitator family transporter [Elusimicrobiota bacterium]
MLKNMIEEKCRACGNRVGWIELFVSIGLGSFKLFIGIMANSHALIGAALYSVQDIISAGVIIISMYHSSKDVNEERPYGHGKIEFIAAVFVSIAVMVGAAFLLTAVARSVFSGTVQVPSWLAFWAAAIAFTVNWFLYKYSLCCGTTLNSPAIISNAEHTKGDVITCACVAVGVFVTKMGFTHLDPLIAVFEVGHVLKLTIRILSRGIKGLMDSSMPDKEATAARKIAEGICGAQNIVSLFGRQLGQKSEISIEIKVDPDMMVEESNRVADRLKDDITGRMPTIGQVNVYVVPADRASDTDRKGENVTKINRILGKYYRQNIKKHDLKFHDHTVELTLDFYGKIPRTMRNMICFAVQGEIEKGLEKGYKVTVIPAARSMAEVN